MVGEREGALGGIVALTSGWSARLTHTVHGNRGFARHPCEVPVKWQNLRPDCRYIGRMI
jgi:hypothetical protein